MIDWLTAYAIGLLLVLVVIALTALLMKYDWIIFVILAIGIFIVVPLLVGLEILGAN